MDSILKLIIIIIIIVMLIFIIYKYMYKSDKVKFNGGIKTTYNNSENPDVLNTIDIISDMIILTKYKNDIERTITDIQNNILENNQTVYESIEKMKRYMTLILNDNGASSSEINNILADPDYESFYNECLELDSIDEMSFNALKYTIAYDNYVIANQDLYELSRRIAKLKLLNSMDVSDTNDINNMICYCNLRQIKPPQFCIDKYQEVLDMYDKFAECYKCENYIEIVSALVEFIVHCITNNIEIEPIKYIGSGTYNIVYLIKCEQFEGSDAKGAKTEGFDKASFDKQFKEYALRIRKCYRSRGSSDNIIASHFINVLYSQPIDKLPKIYACSKNKISDDYEISNSWAICKYYNEIDNKQFENNIKEYCETLIDINNDLSKNDIKYHDYKRENVLYDKDKGFILTDIDFGTIDTLNYISTHKIDDAVANMVLNNCILNVDTISDVRKLYTKILAKVAILEDIITAYVYYDTDEMLDKSYRNYIKGNYKHYDAYTLIELDNFINDKVSEKIRNSSDKIQKLCNEVITYITA